jgi:hypothetical protein
MITIIGSLGVSPEPLSGSPGFTSLPTPGIGSGSFRGGRGNGTKFKFVSNSIASEA